jgi:hypothetical protein
MWNDVFSAVALVFVIEGLLPFLSPGTLRRALLGESELSDNALRFTGLSSMPLVRGATALPHPLAGGGVAGRAGVQRRGLAVGGA